MKQKKLGQIFTPDWIVKVILDEIGFYGENILNKKIIDPSCGNGVFLKEIVKRIISEAKKLNKSIDEIEKILEENIYGIEIDKEIYGECLNNLNGLVNELLKKDLKINWKIFNDNALIKYNNFLHLFDYVVGNPPYIRIHNLDKVNKGLLKKEFTFSSKGNIDIYIAFFELGIKLLNENGKLGYITSNSFLKNSSYKEFRKFLKEKEIIKSITDFKSNKIFKNFSTYTAITVLDLNNSRNYFDYKEFVNGEIKKVNEIKFCELDDKTWAFGKKEDTEFLKKLFLNKTYKLSDFFDIQYGFATLRDKIFIGKVLKEKNEKVLFNNHWIEKSILKKIVKGSKFKGDEKEIEYIIFPYLKKNGRFISMDEGYLKEKFPFTYNYLLLNKKELLKRDIEKNKKWYEFGRSQGLQNCNKEKFVINNLIKDNISFYYLPADVFVYSGIFITKKDDNADWEILKKSLSSKEFKRYIQIKGKDFSSGYKSITTSLIKEFPLIF